MSRRNRCTAALALAAATAFTVSTALAATFELEDKSSANIKDDTGTALLNASVDWASLFDVPAAEQTNPPTGTDGITPTPKAVLPAGIFKAGFYRDFLINETSDATAFTTGTKDIQNISGGGVNSGEWQCKKVNNISDKGDVLNAYAAIYQHDNGDSILAMGVERASSDGTSKVGFWFLKDKNVACNATSGKAETFVGNHMDGDLLVVINFSQGGNNPTAVVYKWTGDATTGSLVLVTTGSECSVGTAATCATTNQVGTLLHSDGGVPWLTQTKTSGPNYSPDLGPLMFFEAQVNLTASNLQTCFNKFMPNTRQSDSVTATVFDYLLGDFSVCSLSAQKSCTAASLSNGGTQVDYTFGVKVKNTGIAPLSVTVAEQVTGCTVQSSQPFSLAAGAEQTVGVACANKGLMFTNSAKVSGSATDGTSVPDVTVTAKSTDFGACQLNVTSDISLTAQCDKVILETANGRLGLDATIKGLVKPPSSSGTEAVNGVKVNVYDQTCTGDIANCASALKETISIGALKYGDSDKSWSHNYDVSSSDNTSTSQCAASAVFQRRVIAFGTGAITGKTYYSSLVSDVPMTVPVDCKPCVDCSDPAQ